MKQEPSTQVQWQTAYTKTRYNSMASPNFLILRQKGKPYARAETQINAF